MRKLLPYIYLFVIIALFVAGGFYLNKHPVNLNSTITGTSGSSTQLTDLGPAPDFTGINHWINSDPLTIKGLQGKVVLIDFWTYSCINCIRTLPYVTKWYDTYKDQGLVVVGVHTPEFAFEKDTGNVEAAVKRFNINYPVAQDNDYGTWNAYGNQYWPAEYLINQKGEIVYQDFGEGNYAGMENAIRQLLGLSAEDNLNSGQDLSKVQSPEMYLGTNRLEYLTSGQTSSTTVKNYSFPQSLDTNTFALAGNWQFTPEYATLAAGSGQIELKFDSAKLYMVASATTPVTLHVTVDGKAQPDVTVSASQLYTLFDSSDYGEHTVIISIPQSGLQAFTFTFG